mgnify:FL=1
MCTVVYNSLTGNTKMLADTIKSVLPNNNNDDIVFVGFWTDKGNADAKTIEYLKLLRNKKIFLFGTCGFGGSEAYFDRILTNVKGNIDSSNEMIGEYMCHGKMPNSVRERYLKMKESDNCPPNIDALIDNFDKALSHPDKKDLGKLSQMVSIITQS